MSNPEFLKEGAAVEDFMRPDRIVIGADDERAIALLRAVYAPFQRNHERLLVMDVRSAELTKYAANAMLATRISFMNELANLADALGADIEQVRQGIGSDPRIGYHFSIPASGYGGSCFPKDVQGAAAHRAAARAAAAHPRRSGGGQRSAEGALLAKITGRLGEDLAGRPFALWGLAFKPNTDDMREAPSRAIVAALLERGAAVAAYDPVAMDEAKRVFGPMPAAVATRSSPIDAVAGADALVVVTEWKEFRSPDFALNSSAGSDSRCCSTAATCTIRRWCAPRASNISASAAGDDAQLPEAFADYPRCREPHARARRRRRDARPLLVRRRRADFAGSAGAGGARSRATKSAPAAPPTSRATPRRSGAQVTLISVIGDDEPGRVARAAARAAKACAPRCIATRRCRRRSSCA